MELKTQSEEYQHNLTKNEITIVIIKARSKITVNHYNNSENKKKQEILQNNENVTEGKERQHI